MRPAYTWALLMAAVLADDQQDSKDPKARASTENGLAGGIAVEVSANGAANGAHDTAATFGASDLTIKPIEVRKRGGASTVFADRYYNLVKRVRDVQATVYNASDELHMPQIPLPQHVERKCEMYGQAPFRCHLLPQDEPCAAGRTAECAKPLGHLRPIGEQFRAVESIETHDVAAEGPLVQSRFFDSYLSQSRPVHIRGINKGSSAVLNPAMWTDHMLRQACSDQCMRSNETQVDGMEYEDKPFQVTVEAHNRIQNNDRGPQMRGLTFCDFLDAYQSDENEYYLIETISDGPLQALLPLVQLPSPYLCFALYRSVYSSKLYMSKGNTSSALHFDTHDNIIVQIDGQKDIWLWHPNESAALYMDHHDKYGLSPIHTDHVDLERFPEFAKSKPRLVPLKPGDAVYIPDGWWHCVVARAQRNLALTFEMNPYKDNAEHWPMHVRRHLGQAGIFWAEYHRTLTAMNTRFAAQRRSKVTGEPIQCKTPASPVTLAALNSMEFSGDPILEDPTDEAIQMMDNDCKGMQTICFNTRLPYEREASSLRAPVNAQLTRVEKVHEMLGLGEVNSVASALEGEWRSGVVEVSPKHEEYQVSPSALNASKLGRLLLQRVARVAWDADRSEGWNLLPGEFIDRVIGSDKSGIHLSRLHHHVYLKGSSIRNLNHHNPGSLVTVVISLSSLAEYEGGPFVVQEKVRMPNAPSLLQPPYLCFYLTLSHVCIPEWHHEPLSI